MEMSGVVGTIELDSLSYGVDRKLLESAKSGTQDINIGIGLFKPVEVSKSLDSSSAILAQAAISGSSLGLITFSWVERGETSTGEGTAPLVFYRVQLDRAFVKRWYTSGSADARPSEELELVYARIGYQTVTTRDGREFELSQPMGWDNVKNIPWEPVDRLRIPGDIIDPTPVNTPPTAVADRFDVLEDSLINFLSATSNDRDAEGDPITIILAEPVQAKGEIQISLGGRALAYRPPQDYSGIELFRYTISDGRGGQNSADITINILALNDRPLIRDELIVLNAPKPIRLTAKQILRNDFDVDGDRLFISGFVATTAKGGTVNLEGDSIVYLPPTDFEGEDTVTYTVSDGEYETTSTLTIQVSQAINDPSQVITHIEAFGRERVLVQFKGTPGREYEIQVSSILDPPLDTWETAAMLTTQADGTLEFEDLNPPSQRFYRFVLRD